MTMAPVRPSWETEEDEDEDEEYVPEFCTDHRLETDCFGHVACLTCRSTK